SSASRRLPIDSSSAFATRTSGGISQPSGLLDTQHIPVLPPLPHPRRLLLLLAAGLASAALLVAWRPEPLRSVALFVQNPSQVDQQARDRLVRRGVSLYGYSSYTDPQWNPQLHQFEAHEQLDAAERREIEAWNPVVWYQTIIASADHEDRYEMRTSR